MEISTNIACRVQCDFCPQELLIEEYSTRNNLKNISYGKPTQMSFETFKKCLSTIPKSVLIGFLLFICLAVIPTPIGCSVFFFLGILKSLLL